MKTENSNSKALLRCGFGRKEITPPLGTPMVGYYRPRFSKGVIDPLFVRAVMFESGTDRYLVVTVDVCLLTKELPTDIRKMISERTGINMDAIQISASHTHTGPLTGKDFASNTVIDPAYLDFLRQQACLAAEDAVADLAPARLFYGKTEAKGISFVRRFRLKNGEVKTNPKPTDEIDYPLGEPNEDLRLLKIVRDGADDVYLVHFGTHADTVGGEYISADYPGYVCSILEGAIPGSKCMFLLAPQGDVAHANRFKPNNGKVISSRANEDFRETAAHARYMGRVIAGQILTICDRTEELDSGEIRFDSLEMQLPTNKENENVEEARMVNELYLAGKKDEIPPSCMDVVRARRILKMLDAPSFYKYSVYAVRIGDFVLAGFPGEPFTEIGRRVYRASPFEHMMLCCQTNATIGYIGTSQAYDEGGYETTASIYKKGADDIFVESMVRLLKQLQ